jgi:hypothetical protein
MPGLPELWRSAVSGCEAYPPELMPILSEGRYRSPRKGVCFMELASYLAGERWSDRPACTHPLLAAVARDVNDCTSGAGRARLGGLIPSVSGLAGGDLHIDARIALRWARLALPVAASGRQQAMAVLVLACERVVADLDGRPAGGLEEQSGRRWRELCTPRSGRAVSPAASRCPRRPFAGTRACHSARRGGGNRAVVRPAA